MIAIPIAVVLFGYWVLYAGVKHASLADAWNCVPQQRQTPGDQSGNIRIITPDQAKRLGVPPGSYTRIPGTNVSSPTVTSLGLGPQNTPTAGQIYIPPINQPNGTGDLVGQAGKALTPIWDETVRDVKSVVQAIGSFVGRLFGR